MPVEIATFWDLVRTALGLDEPRAAQAVAKGIQVLVIGLLTFWIASWVSDRIRKVAKAGHLYGDVASLASRAVALLIVILGLAVALATIGVNSTAVAAILGAATVGLSLSFQDVGRAWVNGAYILIERPYRIGDWVRVGEAEGRVEEIGIRLTFLRAPSGARVVVPNSVVFASAVENSTVGPFDRRTYHAVGIALPAAEVGDAVSAALRGAQHLSHRPPTVTILEARPEGTDANVTVEFDAGHRVDDQVFTRLRERFPEATVSTRPLASPA